MEWSKTHRRIVPAGAMNKDDNYIKVLLANFGKHTYYLLFNREVETKWLSQIISK